MAPNWAGTGIRRLDTYLGTRLKKITEPTGSTRALKTTITNNYFAKLLRKYTSYSSHNVEEFKESSQSLVVCRVQSLKNVHFADDYRLWLHFDGNYTNTTLQLMSGSFSASIMILLVGFSRKDVQQEIVNYNIILIIRQKYYYLL